MIFNELLGTSGITHIEELPLDKFMETIRNLSEYEITEKVDGSEILFGIDESGFYTSRETKGGQRIYDSRNYPVNFSTNYMRSVHEALQQVLPQLEEAGLRIGDQVEAEVLYGEIPNAVSYSKNINHIIFLRTTEGCVNIDLLKKELLGEQIEVTLSLPFTPDGRRIEIKEETNAWQFSRVPNISVNYRSLEKSLQPKTSALVSYLKQPSGVENFSNLVIESLPLNKCPGWCKPQDWKLIKEDVKRVKSEIQKTINETLVSDIKKVLLDYLVTSQVSAFGPTISEGGWIEGVVLRNRNTREQIKIVDKEVFTKVRDFLWESRTNLTTKSYFAEDAQSFMGKLLVGLASAIGHPELGTKQAKRYMRFLGESKEEIIDMLSEGVNFEQSKAYWTQFLINKERELIKELYNYENNKGKQRLDVNMNGQKRTFSYNESIDIRNKQVFSELFNQINHIKHSVTEAACPEDLIMLLVGRQLGEL